MTTTLRRDSDGYEAWVQRTDTPLLVLAVLFLVILVLPVLVHLSPAAAMAVVAANILIWAVFAIDYFVRLYLARNRWQYVKRNVLDLVIVVVPFLRPVRAVRLLRLLRLGSVAGVANRRAASLHARVSIYVGTAAVVIVFLAGIAMYDTEHLAADSNIRTLPDALWWAITTITTVGYGDRYPTTDTGRMIAVCLMVFGIALLGVITAGIAAWFIDRLRPVEQAEARNEATLADVMAELQRLHRRLDNMESPLAAAAQEPLDAGRPIPRHFQDDAAARQ